MTATEVPIICTLEGGGVADRADLMRELGQSLVRVVADRGSARLSFSSDRADELVEFVRAERSCCGFFEFGLVIENGAAELSISAPEDAAWAVRGLVAGFVAGWGGLV